MANRKISAKRNDKLPSELSDFIDILARMLVTDEERRQRGLSRIRETRRLLTGLKIPESEECKLRVLKIKQSLSTMERQLYAANPDWQRYQEKSTDIELQVRNLQRLQEKAQLSARQSERAKNKRKKVTKADLLKFQAEHIRDHGVTRGWKKQACRAFGIDRGTLNKRIAE